ncbi:hypothetical protein [Vibrio sp. F12]|nr:hypothetical protein [Vibrio sp. F12]
MAKFAVLAVLGHFETGRLVPLTDSAGAANQKTPIKLRELEPTMLRNL